jgi:hypothetical protein
MRTSLDFKESAPPPPHTHTNTETEFWDLDPGIRTQLGLWVLIPIESKELKYIPLCYTAVGAVYYCSQNFNNMYIMYFYFVYYRYLSNRRHKDKLHCFLKFIAKKIQEFFYFRLGILWTKNKNLAA